MSETGKISHRRVDMTGLRVGKLTVLGPSSIRGSRGELRWDCKCDCGNLRRIPGGSLRGKVITESCGCLKKTHFVDLTGQAFNDLTVIKHLGKDNEKNQVYSCECICGNFITTQGSDVKTGKIKSCGCRSARISMERYLQDPDKGIQNHIYSEYRCGAESRNYEFSLNKEEFIKLIKQDCYYCGDSPSNRYKHSKVRKSNPTSEPYLWNGIDRVDNDRGYTTDNVVTCCKFCNIAKHLFTQEAYISKAYKIVEQDKKRKGLK